MAPVRPPAATTRPGASGRRSAIATVGTWLWAFLPLLTWAMVAWLPSLHAAVQLRSRNLAWCAAGYVAAVVAAFTLLGVSDGGSATGVAVLGMVALMIGGTVHAITLRPRVFTGRPRVPMQPAFAVALEARKQREDAHALALRDPGMARDLRIGRPDLPRQFVDGGLVDVNHVPPQVLAVEFGLSASDVDKIVAAREHVGGFGNAEELTALAGVQPSTVDWIRDRLIFLRF